MRKIDRANLPLLMSVAEAVEFTGISRSQFYRWFEDETLKPRKVGRATKIPTKDLIDLVGSLPAMGE
jgi:excisionase family DNA binding protein